MSKHTRPLLLAAVAVLGVILAPRPAAAASGPNVGDLPPPKLGWNVKLDSYRGRIVIVSFWASWCAPCRKELPVLASIQKLATRDKVVVFAVNWREDDDTFRRIRTALRGVDLTLLSDAGDYIGRQYGVDAIPHMVIIGRDGRIAAVHIGYGEGELPVIVNEINALWNRPAAAPGEQRPPSPPG